MIRADLIFREAVVEDIKGMQRVRHSVKENVLSDPSLVTDEDCKDYITDRGKGWVCEWGDLIIGFAVADLREDNIWALFVDPVYEKRGVGKKLHELMMDWYFDQQKASVWLSTAPRSRAERFYQAAGWRRAGTTATGEIKFTMLREEWLNRQQGNTSLNAWVS